MSPLDIIREAVITEVGASLLEPIEAQALARRVTERVLHDLGGSQWYLPKLDTELDRRDARMRRDYDGTVNGRQGVKALARREGMTERRCYQILRRRR